jgi:hypothetical protein
MVSPLFCLGSKHLLQDGQYSGQRVGSQAPKSPRESLNIDCAKLVRRNKSSPTLEATLDPPWISLTSGRHRCDDHRAQMFVQLVW